MVTLILDYCSYSNTIIDVICDVWLCRLSSLKFSYSLITDDDDLIVQFETSFESFEISFNKQVVCICVCTGGFKEGHSPPC